MMLVNSEWQTQLGYLASAPIEHGCFRCARMEICASRNLSISRIVLLDERNCRFLGFSPGPLAGQPVILAFCVKRFNRLSGRFQRAFHLLGLFYRHDCIIASVDQ